MPAISEYPVDGGTGEKGRLKLKTPPVMAGFWCAFGTAKKRTRDTALEGPMSQSHIKIGRGLVNRPRQPEHVILLTKTGAHKAPFRARDETLDMAWFAVANLIDNGWTAMRNGRDLLLLPPGKVSRSDRTPVAEYRGWC